MLLKTDHMNKQPAERLGRKREQLILDFMKDNDPQFPRRHAKLFDDYFCKSFEESRVGQKMGIAKNPYAIAALGGYGRQEQSVFSDVDILFLFKNRIPDEAEELVSEILYPLWDMGFEIGHATRTIKESVSLAGDDLEILMSLLDGRFICGISNLFQGLTEGLRKKIIRSRVKKIISMVVENSWERHRQFGDSAYLLEPNLKEGKGGLRDYHTMLWIARIKKELKTPRDLEYFGYLSQGEFESLENALSFISNARNHMHHITGRKSDQLYLDYQAQLARGLGYKEKGDYISVELFLGDLHKHMGFVKQSLLNFFAELGFVENSAHTKSILGKRTKIKGLDVKKNMLSFVSAEAVLKSPLLLMKIFFESLHLGIPISVEAKRIVKELLYIVDDDFRAEPSVVELFNRILMTSSPVLNGLDDMLSTGFLQCLIPEFSRIINRMQFDEYHIYPVERHSLRTVQVVTGFAGKPKGEKEQLCSVLYKEIRHKELLLWVSLLHDIGKGDTAKDHAKQGAEIAKSILKRSGFGAEHIDIASFLVENHLFLIKAATRRDIHDEETVIFCARKIKDIERLKMLYVLTVADSMSTGPKAWNDWTSSLLRDLFLKTMNILKKGELATTEAVETVERKKEDVLALMTGREDKKIAKTCFNFFSPRYMLYVPAENIPGHIELYKRLGNSGSVWDIAQLEEGNTRTVTVCAKNSPGLFSKISGVFTLNSMNILNAQIYTWKNDIALDIFTVTPPVDLVFEDEKWARAETDLHTALADEDYIAGRMKDRPLFKENQEKRTIKRPHRINVDNESSSFFTIIEVYTYDFPGLLFRITNTLFKCGLDIHVAKIATKVDQVVDVFYVRDFNGEKANSTEIVEKITSEIQKMLDAGGTKE